MYQGVVISALIRAYRLLKEDELLDLCEKASLVFTSTVEEGGVKTFDNGYTLYEEYPAYPLPRILDGFLFSLLGLYDLAVETNSQKVKDLFCDGIEGLKANLEFWNYQNIWTRYGAHRYLCPPHYHKLNWLLLSILGHLAHDQMLLDYANRWNGNRRTLVEKIHIYLAFVATKNLARLRLPRN